MINERLRLLRLRLGLKQNEIAEKLNISQPAYNHYESGKRNISIELAIKITKITNCNLQWLLTGKGEMFINTKLSAGSNIKTFTEMFGSEFVEIPLGSGISAGPPEEAYQTDEVFKIPKSLITGTVTDYFALPVTGWSMYPQIHKNDIVILKKLYNWNNLNKKIVAVRMNGEITLKKLLEDHKNKLIILQPSNPKYDTIIYNPNQPDDIEIIGLLIFLFRIYGNT